MRALTVQSLSGSGFVDEANAWREWLLRAVAGDAAAMQPMYSLTGEHRLPEQELDWLLGYEGSRPVRIGNAAAGQFQLDVYGGLLDALHTARRSPGSICLRRRWRIIDEEGGCQC